MTREERGLLRATMLGYMAGIADRPEANPYAYIQAEAWAFEHGREQGRIHRERCEFTNSMALAGQERRRKEAERVEFIPISKPPHCDLLHPVLP